MYSTVLVGWCGRAARSDRSDRDVMLMSSILSINRHLLCDCFRIKKNR